MLKNNVPFSSCISKINDNLIKDTEVLDIVMHNLLEYIRNYSRTSGSLWNYYRYTIDDGDVNVIVSHGKSFKYKTKIVGERPERP